MSKTMSNHLKSYSVHDEAVLATMTHMIEAHPNANVTMASFNVINVEGNGLGAFLQELVKQVPVLEMKAYKTRHNNPKKSKHTVVDNGLEKFTVFFTFHGLADAKKKGVAPFKKTGGK